MKNKFSFLLLFCLLLQNFAFAQDRQPDVVFLKDGSRLEGIITDFTPGEMIRIEVEGQEITVQADEVRRVINNGKPEKFKTPETDRQSEVPPPDRSEERDTPPTENSRPDVVFLKDGSRIKGTIINFIPGEMILMEVDGEEITLEARDIRRVVNNGDKGKQNRAGVLSNGESYDEVYLKDGSIIRGEITDIEQDEYVEITSGDREFRFTYDEIERTRSGVRDSANELYNYEPEPRQIVDPATLVVEGWSNTTYFSVAYGKSLIDESGAGPGIHNVTINQLSPKVGLGFGVGIDSYLGSRGETIFPIYGVYRMYPLPKHREYYLDAGLGYGFAFKNDNKDIINARGGIFATPAVGFRSSSKDGTSLNIEVGYRIQNAYFEEQGEFTENDLQIRDVNYRRVVFRIGLMFWQKSARKGVKMKTL